MPYICSICRMEIQPDDPMLSDASMNLAHAACVKKATVVTTEIYIPSVTVSPLPPAPPTPRPAMEGAFPAPAPIPCVECGQPAIGMCPHCKGHVHQDYGYNGPNCSGRHEGKCEGSRKSRELNPKPLPVKLGPLFDTEPIKPSLNGKHKSKAKQKRGRR